VNPCHFPTIPKRFRNRGFSLIDLMITVAIVGILAAIAYPSYLSQVQKSRRTQAKLLLAEAAQLLERNMTLYNCYNFKNPGQCTDQTGTNEFVLPTTWNSVPSESAMYTVSLVVNNITYTLTAAPVDGTSQKSDACGSFTLDNRGIRDVTGGTSTDAATCWGQ
jgi:type IV pilus assembly protein PilE